MTPDMSVTEMVDSFVYVVKGSKVIDRRMTDWGQAYWAPEGYIKHMVLSLADMRTYFGHRRTKWSDPIKEWLKHPSRLTAPSLADAMKLADAVKRGEIEPIIDVDAIIRNGKINSAVPPHWMMRGKADIAAQQRTVTR